MSRNESVLSVLSESGIYVSGLVNHRLMCILLDTGAAVSVFGESTWKKKWNCFITGATELLEYLLQPMAMSRLFWEKLKCEFAWERLNAPGLL